MKQNGGRIIEQCRIIGIEPLNHGINGYRIQTTQGQVTCDIFVNCGGQWAKKLGDLCGVNIPLSSAEHYYIVTKPSPDIEAVDSMMPVVRDPDGKSGYIYFREWSGGMLCGSFEKHAKSAFADDIHHNIPPNDFEFGLFDDDWDHYEPIMEDIISRCPMFENAEVQMLCGPESFTMDSKYLCGDVSELFNYFVCAGMNSSGIAGSCGVGKLMSNWIINGNPTYMDNDYKYKNDKLYQIERDLFNCYPSQIDIKRFHSYSKAINVQINGAKESLVGHINIANANGLKSNKTVSNIRCSPCYHYQKYQQNAYFISGTNNAYSVPAFFGKFKLSEHETKSIYGMNEDIQSIVDNELKILYENEKSLIFDRSVDSKWLINNDEIFKDCDKYKVTKWCAKDKDWKDANVCSLMVVNKKTNMIETMGDLRKLNEKMHLFQCQDHLQSAFLNKQCRIRNNINLIDASSQYCMFHIVGQNALNHLKSLCHSSSIQKLDNLSNGGFEWIDIGSYKVAICGNVQNSQNFCCKSNEYQILIQSDYAPHFYEFLCESELYHPSGYFVWDSLRIKNRIAKLNVDFDASVLNKEEASSQLARGEIKNGGKIPFGGEPIVNEKGECFGHVTSVGYRGDQFEKYFIANMNFGPDPFLEKNLWIKVGDEYTEINVHFFLIHVPSLMFDMHRRLFKKS